MLARPVVHPQHGYVQCSTLTSIDFTASFATPQDITGATVTLTSRYPNAKLIVHAVVDMNYRTVSAAIAATENLLVDGATGVGQVILAPRGTNICPRMTLLQDWEVNVPTAKTFIVKLQCVATGTNFNTCDIAATHTGFTYVLWDAPGQ